LNHHGNEHIGDAGRAHFAKAGELLTSDMIEQQMLRPNTWRS